MLTSDGRLPISCESGNAIYQKWLRWSRFALEASLRRAREGVEAVLRKSTARADDVRTRLRAVEAAAAAAAADERRQVARRAELAEALLGV